MIAVCTVNFNIENDINVCTQSSVMRFIILFKASIDYFIEENELTGLCDEDSVFLFKVRTQFQVIFR